MGYRSDVFIGMRKKDVPFFVEHYKDALRANGITEESEDFKDNFEGETLDDVLGASIFAEDDNSIVCKIAYVKWYNSFSDVKAFNSALGDMTYGLMPYNVIVIGEDGALEEYCNLNDQCEFEIEELGFEMYPSSDICIDGIGTEKTEPQFIHICEAVIDGERCGMEFISNVTHSVCPCCGVEDRMTVTK